MLTSPAEDDNPRLQCRRVNMYTKNCSDVDYHENQATSRQMHANSAVLFQDGNVNANTFVQHHGRIVEGFNNDFQGHNGGLHVTNNFHSGTYINSSNTCPETENNKNVIEYNRQEWNSEINNEQNLRNVDVFGGNICNTNSFHELSSSQYGQSSSEPLKKIAQSETNLFQPKSFNHDAEYSAFKKVNKSSFYECQNVEQNFENIFNAHYQTNIAGVQDSGSFDFVPEVDNTIRDKFFVHRGNKNSVHEPLDIDKRSTNNDSLCSVTSDETEGFEIIDWDKNDTIENADISDQLQLSKAYITPSTSPQLDLSHLQDFLTATVTPEDIRDELKSVDGDVKIFSNGIDDFTDEFFVIADQNDDYEANCKEETISDNQKESNKGDDKGQINETEVKKERDTSEVKHCYKCGKVIKKTTKPADTEIKTSTENVERKVTETSQSNDTKMEQPPEQSQPVVQRREGPRLQLPTPPFISVDSLLYEADTETGTARIIGRGSFGQVYKVRFSDPNYYHLPVVVKEFLEEFSNSRDIIEEAQRLYYLQDTGYVPVCYGLLCFNDSNRPKYGIVQEYVGTGLTLEQMLWDQYQFPVEVWLSISYQCCDGLSRFHEKGILLNDIKTNNIIMEFRHNAVKIKFIDFGLATDMRGKRYKNTKSLDNYVYLAPEVRKHGQWTNIASDIYSLGYMLGQLYNFTGLNVLDVISNLSMDQDPEMRLPVQGAASLIHDSIVKSGYDPGVLCLNI
ncbi:hypothetical protein ACF0H5_005888 [Mactra antiquata]